jgi:hypothetical protein
MSMDDRSARLPGVTWAGVGLIAVSGAVMLLGLVALRSGRAVTPWSVVLAAAGAGVAAGGLLVQDQPGVASWVVALPLGALFSVVHARALFAPGGPLRT